MASSASRVLDLLKFRLRFHLDHAMSPYWRARAPEVFQALALNEEDVLLEIGCGLGHWTTVIQRQVKRVYALDVSDKPMRIAQRRSLQSVGAESSEYLCASADALPFSSNSFPKALAVDVIEHIADDSAVLNEIYRVLRPGGRLVMTTLIESRPHYIYRMDFQDHVREYTPAQFSRLLKGSGFLVESLFHFYYAPRLFARELQMLVEGTSFGHSLPISLIIGLFGRMIGDLEVFWRFGSPAGMGILAEKR